MTNPKMQNTLSRIRTVQLVLALAFGVLSLSVTADSNHDNMVNWCKEQTKLANRNCDSRCLSKDFAQKTETSYKTVDNNELIDSIRSVHFMGSDCDIETLGLYKTHYHGNFKGKACVCRENDEHCVRIWGPMSYLNRAYDETFTEVGLNYNGCGEDTPTINGRRAGYLRLESDPGNCIQSTADPAHSGGTHFWGNCATGDNQQRRVISYHTQSHQLQFASKTDLCLLAPSTLAAAEDSFIYISECDTATAAQREWALRGGQIQLRADNSKCIMTSEISVGSDIVLGACSAGAKTNWQLTWTQDH